MPTSMFLVHNGSGLNFVCSGFDYSNRLRLNHMRNFEMQITLVLWESTIERRPNAINCTINACWACSSSLIIWYIKWKACANKFVDIFQLRSSSYIATQWVCSKEITIFSLPLPMSLQSACISMLSKYHARHVLGFISHFWWKKIGFQLLKSQPHARCLQLPMCRYRAIKIDMRLAKMVHHVYNQASLWMMWAPLGTIQNMLNLISLDYSSGAQTEVSRTKKEWCQNIVWTQKLLLKMSK